MRKYLSLYSSIKDHLSKPWRAHNPNVMSWEWLYTGSPSRLFTSLLNIVQYLSSCISRYLGSRGLLPYTLSYYTRVPPSNRHACFNLSLYSTIIHLHPLLQVIMQVIITTDKWLILPCGCLLYKQKKKKKPRLNLSFKY